MALKDLSMGNKSCLNYFNFVFLQKKKKMRYIANVISKSKNYKFVPWINVSCTMDGINRSVPTLIVGTDLAKTYLGSKINFINRKVDEKTFWTYKVTEKRSSNEIDVNKFKDAVVSTLKKKIKFTNFNVLTRSISDVKRFLSFLKNNSGVCYVISDKNLYISYNDNVVGVSFDEIEYIGIKKDKILRKLSLTNNKKTMLSTFCKEFDSEFFKNDEILLSAMFCYLNS